MIDRAKLAKLLALTASDHDPEALSAMRMANAMVKAADTTWDQLLAPPQSIVTVSVHRTNPPWQDMTPRPSPQQDGDWVPPHLKQADVINMMFETVYRGKTAEAVAAHASFWEWLDNVHEFWVKHGQLSQGRYDALRRCYSRAVKTRR